VKPIHPAALLLGLLALAACAPDMVPARPDIGVRDLGVARSVALRVIAEQDATISSAFVTRGSGTVFNNNTGEPCTSGRRLQVLLIGRFPHVVTTGHPVLPGQPISDLTVGAMRVTVDPATGRPCLIGVYTLERGPIRPRPGATPISIDPPISPGPLWRCSAPR
jgi:hypothetical protein